MTQYLDHTRIAQTLLDQQGDINRLTEERDGAYRERAQLLAWLATLHGPNAVLAPALDIDDEDGWHLLFLTVASRQLSWHISPRDMDLLKHVERVDFGDPRAEWDGHTTDEKYERIRTLPWGEMRDAVRTPGPAEAAIERVRGIKKSPSRSPYNTHTNAQDDGWDQALDEVHAALDGSEQQPGQAVWGSLAEYQAAVARVAKVLVEAERHRNQTHPSERQDCVMCGADHFAEALRAIDGTKQPTTKEA